MEKSKEAGVKYLNEKKVITIHSVHPNIEKPSWIKVKLLHDNKVQELKLLLREHNLHTVCEEANCPNINECFSNGTATFMIMGDICTRKCPFCAVGHGRPLPLDKDEPLKLAESVKLMKLKYVVITSVDRDDLPDGGAQHFVDCMREIKKISSNVKIEILVPDFRGRLETAINILASYPPDVFNHNLETVERLYKTHRPGAKLPHSLNLLRQFKEICPSVPTKSGIMVGLGETNEEIHELMLIMRKNLIDMITIGQYLQPSKHHAPVMRYMHPDEFSELDMYAKSIFFKKTAIGPLVRSSYHADSLLDSI